MCTKHEREKHVHRRRKQGKLTFVSTNRRRKSYLKMSPPYVQTSSYAYDVAYLPTIKLASMQHVCSSEGGREGGREGEASALQVDSDSLYQYHHIT